MTPLVVGASASIRNEEVMQKHLRLVSKNIIARTGDLGERVFKKVKEEVDRFEEEFKQSKDPSHRASIHPNVDIFAAKELVKERELWQFFEGELIGFLPQSAQTYAEQRAKERGHGTERWLDAWTYLIVTFSGDEYSDKEKHRRQFEKIQWTDDPGSICAFGQAFKDRLDRLTELEVYCDGDDLTAIVNKMIDAFGRAISKSPADSRKERELIFTVWKADFKKERRYQSRLHRSDFDIAFKYWMDECRHYFREEEHERRTKGGKATVELPDDSVAQSGDRKCMHCGKKKSEHEGGVFDKCNKAANDAKKEKKQLDNTEVPQKTETPKEDQKGVDSTEKGKGKGQAGKTGTSQEEQKKKGFKKWADLTQQEKDDIAKKRALLPCPKLSIDGQCDQGNSCCYSHNKELCKKAIETECKFGASCVKRNRFLHSKDYKNYPCCVYLHEGKAAKKKANVDSIEVSEKG